MIIAFHEFHTYVLTLGFCLLGTFLVSTDLLQSRLDQMIQSEALTIAGVLHHEVSEPGGVSGCVEHHLGGEDGAVNLQHLLLEYKVAPPGLEKVGLEGAAHGTEVKLSRHSTIDCKTLVVEESSLEGIFHLSPGHIYQCLESSFILSMKKQYSGK